MTLTARELVRRIARDSGLRYSDVVRRVNAEMAKGESLISSVQTLARETGLDPRRYVLDPLRIIDRIREVLTEDHTRTLMISAVIAQMVESPRSSRLPLPAFFAFMEILSEIEGQMVLRRDTPQDVEETATEVIELITTLVSLICAWSKTGIKGVAPDCPAELRSLAKTVLRKTRLYQGGMWVCISCGRVVSLRDVRGLVCRDCDKGPRHGSAAVHKVDSTSAERHRIGYGAYATDEES